MEDNNVIEIPEEMRSQMTIGGEPEVTTEPVQTPAVKESTTPIYLGGRRFDSMEELAQYTHELQVESYKPRVETSKALENANRPKPSDLMFSDPDSYHEYTIEEAEKRVMTKLSQAENEKRVWNSFYNQYPDLKDREIAEIVEFQFNKRKNDMAHLPADKVLDTIGKEVRSLISKVRGKPEGGKELPSGGAVVASSSNNIPSPKTTVQSEPEDMATQLRRFQKRGR